MKYIKTFERYSFIDTLGLQDIENELSYIENLYRKFNKDKIIDCFYDLEDFGVEPKLISGIYDMSTLLDKRNLRTSDNDRFTYYKTPEFDNSLYNDNKDLIGFLKIVNIEILQNMYNTKSTEQIDALWNSNIVRSNFSEAVRNEVKGIIDNLINKNWEPCLVLSLDKIKYFDMKPTVIDTLQGINERLNKIYNMKMIVSGSSRKPLLIILNND